MSGSKRYFRVRAVRGTDCKSPWSNTVKVERCPSETTSIIIHIENFEKGRPLIKDGFAVLTDWAGNEISRVSIKNGRAEFKNLQKNEQYKVQVYNKGPWYPDAELWLETDITCSEDKCEKTLRRSNPVISDFYMDVVASFCNQIDCSSDLVAQGICFACQVALSSGGKMPVTVYLDNLDNIFSDEKLKVSVILIPEEAFNDENSYLFFTRTLTVNEIKNNNNKVDLPVLIVKSGKYYLSFKLEKLGKEEKGKERWILLDSWSKKSSMITFGGNLGVDFLIPINQKLLKEKRNRKFKFIECDAHPLLGNPLQGNILENLTMEKNCHYKGYKDGDSGGVGGGFGGGGARGARTDINDNNIDKNSIDNSLAVKIYKGGAWEGVTGHSVVLRVTLRPEDLDLQNKDILPVTIIGPPGFKVWFPEGKLREKLEKELGKTQIEAIEFGADEDLGPALVRAMWEGAKMGLTGAEFGGMGALAGFVAGAAWSLIDDYLVDGLDSTSCDQCKRGLVFFGIPNPRNGENYTFYLEIPPGNHLWPHFFITIYPEPTFYQSSPNEVIVRSAYSKNFNEEFVWEQVDRLKLNEFNDFVIHYKGKAKQCFEVRILGPIIKGNPFEVKYIDPENSNEKIQKAEEIGNIIKVDENSIEIVLDFTDIIADLNEDPYNIFDKLSKKLNNSLPLVVKNFFKTYYQGTKLIIYISRSKLSSNDNESVHYYLKALKQSIKIAIDNLIKNSKDFSIIKQKNIIFNKLNLYMDITEFIVELSCKYYFPMATATFSVCLDKNKDFHFKIKPNLNEADPFEIFQSGACSIVDKTDLTRSFKIKLSIQQQKDSIDFYCSPNNLPACTTPSDCEEAGGYWCNGQCQSEECEEKPSIPPTEQYIGLCDTDCQDRSPIKLIDSTRFDANFNYTENVDIIAGFFPCNFERIYWLNPQGCTMEENFVWAWQTTSLSCSEVELPESDGYLFWLVSPVPLSYLDFKNGAYELLFFPVGSCQ